jgi:hypothetical protein
MRFLLEFCSVPATFESLACSIAWGDAECVRMLWDRFAFEDQESEVRSLAQVALNFHRPVLLEWLVRDCPTCQLASLALDATSSFQADGLLVLLNLGWDPSASDRSLFRSMGAWPEVRLLEWVCPCDRFRWTEALLESGDAAAVFLLDNQPESSRDLCGLADLSRRGRGVAAPGLVAFLRDEWLRGHSADRAFGLLLDHVGLRLAESSLDTWGALLAWLAVSEGEVRATLSLNDAHVAVLRGSIGELRRAIDSGASLDSEGSGVGSPLALAQSGGRDDLSLLLLEAGALELVRPACGCCGDECQLGRNPWMVRSRCRRVGVAFTSLLGLAAVCVSVMFCLSGRELSQASGAGDYPWFVSLGLLAGAFSASLLSTCQLTRFSKRLSMVGGTVLAIALVFCVAVGLWRCGALWDESLDVGLRTRTWHLMIASLSLSVSCVASLLCVSVTSHGFNGLPWPVFECGREVSWWLSSSYLLLLSGLCVGVAGMLGSISSYDAEPRALFICGMSAGFVVLLLQPLLLSGALLAVADAFCLVFGVACLAIFAVGGAEIPRLCGVVVSWSLPHLVVSGAPWLMCAWRFRRSLPPGLEGETCSVCLAYCPRRDGTRFGLVDAAWHCGVIAVVAVLVTSVVESYQSLSVNQEIMWFDDDGWWYAILILLLLEAVCTVFWACKSGRRIREAWFRRVGSVLVSAVVATGLVAALLGSSRRTSAGLRPDPRTLLSHCLLDLKWWPLRCDESMAVFLTERMCFGALLGALAVVPLYGLLAVGVLKLCPGS